MMSWWRSMSYLSPKVSRERMRLTMEEMLREQVRFSRSPLLSPLPGGIDGIKKKPS